MTLFWLAIGVAVGVVGTLPLLLVMLRRAVHRAREAEGEARHSQRLSELGSMTSGLAHEIRNPLSTVGLNAQLLHEDLASADLDPEQRERLMHRIDSLAREVDRLGHILGDFLDFAGRVKLDPQPCDLRTIVEELVDFYHPQCDQAGVVLRVQMPEDPVRVHVDEGLLKQALLNLLINATQILERAAEAEGGEAGELILKVDEDSDFAWVHVIDTGPGIEEEDRERIFHPYVSKRKGGTGLGLPTARRIVEEHGGRLHVESVVGDGSDFVIMLPRA
ncbi:MAG: two-component sensor histidine kinase [Phycisphaerae bacterium]|nr:two-component sensor histidine kinase [Phycisphaerae bacterium]MDG1899077.1 HAMP domain-containing sensor histidine kinase [Phycisphaerales bacterium]|tara:strand:- start:26362 stop:27189 length:828 start_codon:yes stop_codon:yes gene_type:complete